MRRLIILASLLVAGCATAPEPPPSQPAVVAPAAHIRGDLIGLTAGELVGRFGTPALQVREGNGLKLQFRAPRCILDAYLYPPPGAVGPERVTYVDTRLRSGADTDQKHCVTSIEGA